MGVEAQDLSNFAGSPVMLYDFYRKSVPTMTGTPVETHWRYTSADRDFVLDGHTYAALAIGDDGIRQTGNTTQDQLAITMPYTAKIPQMFAGSPPSDPIYCIIRHANYNETDSYLAWAGIVGAVSRGAETVSATVKCNTIGATMDRSGLRLAWARGCPHDLYGTECRADPTLFHVSGAVIGLNGALIMVDAFASGVTPPQTLLGGFVEWIDEDGHAERLGIIEHVAADRRIVRVMGTTDRITSGQTIHAFLGCDRKIGTCSGVFNNQSNFGGHVYMPDTNPFSGDTIF